MYRILAPKAKGETYLRALEREVVNPRDVFNRWPHTTPVTVFESNYDFLDDPYHFESATTGGGGASRTDPGSYYTLSSTNTGTVLRQSRRYLPYRVGATRTTICGCTLLNVTSGATTAFTVRVGVFDSTSNKSTGRISGDGYFFQYTSGAMSIVQRSYVTGSQVDTTVAQASWNNDTLNGSGYSGYTLSLTTPTAVVIEDSCSDLGVVRVGFILDGQVVWAHNFLPSTTKPAVTTSRLPIRYEFSISGTAVGNMFQTSCASFIELDPAASVPKSIQLSYTTSTTSRVSNGPVLTLCAKSTANRTTIWPRKIDLLNTSRGVSFQVQVLVNATVTGTTYAAFSQTHSVVQIDTAATAASGGIEVWGELVPREVSKVTVNLPELQQGLNASISGVADTLTIMVKVLGSGRIDLLTSIQWSEDR